MRFLGSTKFQAFIHHYHLSDDQEIAPPNTSLSYPSPADSSYCMNSLTCPTDIPDTNSPTFSSSRGFSPSCPTSFQDTSPDKLSDTQDIERETIYTPPHEEHTHDFLHISDSGLDTDVTGFESILPTATPHKASTQ